MGQSEIAPDDAMREQLLEAARALVLRGDNKFSVATLCKQAGVEKAVFNTHFTGKTALMAALMQVRPAPEPVSKAEATSEPSVPAPDAWLERRLRVFERALNALEAKAETTAREQARAIAQLEERLGGAASVVIARAPTLVPQAPAAAAPRAPESGEVSKSEAGPVFSLASEVEMQEQGAAEAESAEPESEPGPKKKPVSELLEIAPLPVAGMSREKMADVLQSAREAVRAAAAVEPEKRSLNFPARARWLAVGALALVALFLCIGLSLGRGALSASARESDGVAYRHVAEGELARTIALADAGDARAQARLALAYLRGEGVASDPVSALRWSAVAAKAGQPVAQYLLGAMYQQGDHVQADPARAFALFAAAADKGNLKAMHNLGIAYAQGLGTTKDDTKAVEWFTRAAERGYIDSAFDLAVLYERGQGVPQDLRQAMKWYGIAGLAGDAASKARADFLRGQLKPADARLAANAAMAFAPLPALGEANSL